MDNFTESEMNVHAFGMKACMLGKSRSNNPYDHNQRDEISMMLCRAWFRGWDDANRAMRSLS